MKRQFSDLVERGRDVSPVNGWGTSPGDRQGRFRLRTPFGLLLTVIVCDGGDEDGWKLQGLPGERWEHVSVSTPNRCPTWEEMCWVKSLFFEPEECVVQLHPPESEYVNTHPYTLRLWRPTETAVPLPPRICV